MPGLLRRPCAGLCALALVFALMALGGCGDDGGGTTSSSASTSSTTQPSTTTGPSTTPPEGPTTTILAEGLFLLASPDIRPPTDDHILRARAVRLDTSLLLDAGGSPRELAPGSRVPFNLFADAVFTGIVESAADEQGAYTWLGYLEDVEFSSFFIVYTAGVFIVHVASPRGVFEASVISGDIYRLVEIDQTALPGGEG